MGEPVCHACGLSGAGTVRAFETWATSQAACDHAACEDCLSRHIWAELPRCCKEQQVRISCCVAGCAKMMPQALVLKLSPLARKLARTIDESGTLPFEFTPGPQPGQHDRRVCHVCNDSVGSMLQLAECGDWACLTCWRQWVDEQVPFCRGIRDVRFRCLGAGCQQRVPTDLACLISTEARSLERQVTFRRRLQNNPLYPPAVQVNCPRQGCIGLGYLGYDTVMCFLCEHQWNATGEAPEDGIPTEGLKRCPGCQMQIEKNGGCDHMTCRCGFEFYWTTLNPYRDDQAQVVAAQPALPEQVQEGQGPAAAADAAPAAVAGDAPDREVGAAMAEEAPAVIMPEGPFLAGRPPDLARAARATSARRPR